MKYLLLLCLAVSAFAADGDVLVGDVGARTITVTNSGSLGGTRTVTLPVGASQKFKFWPSLHGYPERGSESACAAPCGVTLLMQNGAYSNGDYGYYYEITDSSGNPLSPRRLSSLQGIPAILPACGTAPFTHPFTIHGAGLNYTECISFSIAGGTDVTNTRLWMRLFNMRPGLGAISVNSKAYHRMDRNPLLGLSCTSFVCTGTTRDAHGFTTNDVVQIMGATRHPTTEAPGGYFDSTTWTVASTPTAKTFTFAVASGHTGEQAGGGVDLGISVSKDFLYADERGKFFGGLEGNRGTFEAVVPLGSTDLVAGQNNTINMRFTGDPNHVAHGYYILDLNVLTGADFELDQIVVTGTGGTHLLATARCTATCTSGWANGNTVIIRDAPGPRWRFNGPRVITIVDGTHFTFPWGPDLAGETPNVAPFLTPNDTYVVPTSNNTDYAPSPHMYATRALIPSTDFQYLTPDWTSTGNTTNGQTAWQGGTLKDPNPYFASHATLAHCADCHTKTGVDLKYFGFDKKVIRAAARDRGLSDTQAEDIIAYIGANSATNYQNGRPWNPPYQPAPDQDSKAIDQWAAGGGEQWICGYDNCICEYLAPGCLSDGTGGSHTEWAPTGNINMRQIPKYLMMPHWMKWLPVIHPVDFYNQKGIDWTLLPAPINYAADLSLTANNFSAFSGASYLDQANSANADSATGFSILNFPFYFADSYRPDLVLGATRDSKAAGFYFPSQDIVGYDSRFKWYISRCWEILHTRQFEGFADQYHQDQDGALNARAPARDTRGWPRSCRVFSMSPHKDILYPESGLTFGHTREMDSLTSFYTEIAMWYVYQDVFVSGERTQWFNREIDHNYLPGYNNNLTKYRPLFYTEFAEMAWLPQQTYGFANPMSDFDAFATGYLFFTNLQPGRYFGLFTSDAAKGEVLQAYADSLYAFVNTFSTGTWQTAVAASGVTTIPMASALNASNNCGTPTTGGCVASGLAHMLPIMKHYGVGATVLGNLVTWGDAVFSSVSGHTFATDRDATCHMTTTQLPSYLDCSNYASYSPGS